MNSFDNRSNINQSGRRQKEERFCYNSLLLQSSDLTLRYKITVFWHCQRCNAGFIPDLKGNPTATTKQHICEVHMLMSS